MRYVNYRMASGVFFSTPPGFQVGREREGGRRNVGCLLLSLPRENDGFVL